MKSIVIHGPRDLRIEERDEEAPGPGEVQIRIAAGGICGSDLHYFNHGGFGTVRLREPMILGHEVAGHVAKLGEGVTGLEVGELVAYRPRALAIPAGSVPTAITTSASTCDSTARPCCSRMSKSRFGRFW